MWIEIAFNNRQIKALSSGRRLPDLAGANKQERLRDAQQYQRYRKEPKRTEEREKDVCRHLTEEKNSVSHQSRHLTEYTATVKEMKKAEEWERMNKGEKRKTESINAEERFQRLQTKKNKISRRMKRKLTFVSFTSVFLKAFFFFFFFNYLAIISFSLFEAWPPLPRILAGVDRK